MSKLDAANPVARSWRDIPQTVTPRAMSAEGRRRLTFSTAKAILGTVVLGVAAWGGFEIWYTFQTAPQSLAAAGQAEPVKAIELRTDGVLDHAWVQATLGLGPRATLMELDLPALQARLTASGQVRQVVLGRKFPATLTVALQERTPVVRVRGEMEKGVQTDFLVARDGTVFVGTGFAPELIDSLPWLAGVSLTRAGDGIAPLTGIDRVADLLTVTQVNAPGLYRSWNVVDLSRFERDSEIVIRARDIPEVIFGLRDDFFTQVALLDSTIEQIAMNPALPRPARINLAVGGRQVPVAFDTKSPRAAEPAKAIQVPNFFRSAPRSNSL